MQIGSSTASVLAQLNGPRTQHHFDNVAAAAPAAAQPRAGVERQAALRVIASEVLHALGGPAETPHHGQPGSSRGYGPVDPAGLGAVAHALRIALQRGSGDGSDPVPDLLARIDAGIDTASQTLARLGLDDAAVSAAVAAFRERVGGLIDATVAGSAPAAQSLTAVSAQQVRTERAQLELVTQDGDVLRIRVRSREAERVDVAAISNDNSTRVTAQIQSKTSTRVKVEVEGSLDAGERKAIEDFLAKVDALTNDFFAGDVEQAFAAGAALEFDGEEIAAFSLKLTVSERIRIQAVDQTIAPPTARAPAPASPSPVLASVQPDPAPPVPSPRPATLITTPDSPADAVSHAAAEPRPISPPPSRTSALETIQAFVRRALATADTPLSIGRLDVAWAAKVRFVAAAIEQAQPHTARPGATLLGNILDHAAEQAAPATESTAQRSAA